MTATLINTEDDMQWLRDVHLPGLNPRFKSAIIEGNEDAPDWIAVFEKRMPDILDNPYLYKSGDDDKFHLQGVVEPILVNVVGRNEIQRSDGKA